MEYQQVVCRYGRALWFHAHGGIWRKYQQVVCRYERAGCSGRSWTFWEWGRCQ
jgi:hypothetical protein